MRDIEKLRALKEKFGMDDFNPTTYAYGSPEYKKLEWVADYIQKHTDIVCWVDDTYFDFGQKWKWTTILAKGSDWDYQLLTPTEQGLIMCDGAEQEIAEYIVEGIKISKKDID